MLVLVEVTGALGHREACMWPLGSLLGLKADYGGAGGGGGEYMVKPFARDHCLLLLCAVGS